MVWHWSGRGRVGLLTSLPLSRSVSAGRRVGRALQPYVWEAWPHSSWLTSFDPAAKRFYDKSRGRRGDRRDRALVGACGRECSRVCSRTGHNQADGGGQNNTGWTVMGRQMPRSGHVFPGQGHIRKRGGFRLLIRRAGFETLAAHSVDLSYSLLILLPVHRSTSDLRPSNRTLVPFGPELPQLSTISSTAPRSHLWPPDGQRSPVPSSRVGPRATMTSNRPLARGETDDPNKWDHAPQNLVRKLNTELRFGYCAFWGMTMAHRPIGIAYPLLALVLTLSACTAANHTHSGLPGPSTASPATTLPRTPVPLPTPSSPPHLQVLAPPAVAFVSASDGWIAPNVDGAGPGVILGTSDGGQVLVSHNTVYLAS